MYTALAGLHQRSRSLCQKSQVPLCEKKTVVFDCKNSRSLRSYLTAKTTAKKSESCYAN